ncbi:hypothetical protein RIF29_35455 [Crotalaria pallida]|uniref:BHLH domain-containing protein n=1 Tax=Crotalaria pallida TaxID=3830 RepID=A0AAN9HV62_CROPI
MLFPFDWRVNGGSFAAFTNFYSNAIGALSLSKFLMKAVIATVGMEDPTFFHQYPMDSFDFLLDDLDFKPFSSSTENYNNSSHHKRFHYETEQNSFPNDESLDHSVVTPATRPTKQLKTMMSSTTTYTWDNNNNNASNNNSSSSSSSKLISFEHSNASSSLASQQYHYAKPKMECSENLDFGAVNSQGGFAYEDKSFQNFDKQVKKAANTRVMMRNPTQAQDHVLAERKRREKLSQRFIALSAMVPGLKKMDKATVLGDAIKYVKQLQERVKTLEERAEEKAVESAVFVKRSILFSDDEDSSSSDENSDQPLPEIEARVSGKDVLIRIHCVKHNARSASILNELEKYHLTIQSSTFLPFGNNTLDITIVAQMNKEHNSVTAKDLIKSLRQCLRKSI